jgi:hypothetical protein
MRLTFWYAKCLDDGDCYSIRERTKKEAVRQVERQDHSKFGAVEKIVIEYTDGFDLLDGVASENGFPCLKVN